MEQGFDLGRALERSGGFGLLLVAACVAVVAVAVLLLVLPARRRRLDLMIVGYILLCLAPLGLGWGAKKRVEALTERVLAMLKEPTPKDRETGYRDARDVFWLGALLTIPGAVLLPLVWLRRRGDADAAPSESDAWLDAR